MLSEAIFRSAAATFGIDLSTKPSWEYSASNEDLDKVRSTIKQFYRDWSAEGKSERDASYLPIMEELESRFGEMGEDKLVFFFFTNIYIPYPYSYPSSS